MYQNHTSSVSRYPLEKSSSKPGHALHELVHVTVKLLQRLLHGRSVLDVALRFSSSRLPRPP